MSIIRINFFIFLVFAASCSSADSREDKILEYSGEHVSKYQVYLVDPKQYTTDGARYHTKYHNYLIGLARFIVEEKKVEIVKRSIGFYYDKRENKKNKLYLGVDVTVALDSTVLYSTYKAIAIINFQKYLNDLLYIVHSCKTVFTEEEIIGTVIGIRWKRTNNEMVNIWIDQNDVIRYEKKEITFNELILRNYITNTDGKIIRLSI